jgi:hypothetical protein
MASRTALVATTSVRVTPSWSASVAILVSVLSAFWIATSLSFPVSDNPAPNLGAAFISSTTRIVPDGETSAIVWRMEFEPMSIAEMRMSASLPCVGVLEALGVLRVRRGFAAPAMC